MKKRLLLILFIFIFILTSCKSKYYIDIVNVKNLNDDNYLYEEEFDGYTSIAYISSNTLKEYSFLEMDYGYKIIIDSFFNIDLKNLDKIEKEEINYYKDTNLLKYKDKDVNIEIKDIDTLISYIESEYNDNFISPMKFEKAILTDLETHDFKGKNKTEMGDAFLYELYLPVIDLKLENSEYLKLIKEYLNEDAFNELVEYISNIFNEITAPGDLNVDLLYSKSENNILPVFEMYTYEEGKKCYFFNFTLSDLNSEIRNKNEV